MQAYELQDSSRTLAEAVAEYCAANPGLASVRNGLGVLRGYRRGRGPGSRAISMGHSATDPRASCDRVVVIATMPLTAPLAMWIVFSAGRGAFASAIWLLIVLVPRWIGHSPA